MYYHLLHESRRFLIFLSVVIFISGCNEATSTVDLLTGRESPPDVQFISIQSGSFTFGSAEELPCRAPNKEQEVPVTLTRSFLIAATEITQAQWSAMDFPNPSQEPKDPNKPVTFVNFFEAAVWCNKLSRLEGLDPCYDFSSCSHPVGTGCGTDEKWPDEGCVDAGRNFSCNGNIHRFSDWYTCPGYRLPTTAEWEYAAKAGVTETRTYGGDLNGEMLSACSLQPALEDIAWYCNNSGGEIHPVGQKSPNPWGLYDTLGNAHEWADYFSDGQPLNYDKPDQSLTDPIGPLVGEMKEIRSDSFFSTGCLVRSASNFNEYPFNRVFDIGFRPVRTIIE